MRYIKIKFNSPFHIGRGLPNDYGASETMIHSDTIKAALFSMAVRIDQKWANKSKEFHDSFSVSSAYPFFKNSLFFPRPLHLGGIGIEGMGEMDARKIQKGIKFLEAPLFELILNGKKLPTISEDQILNKEFVFSKSITNFKNEKVYASEVQQRVKVGIDEMGVEGGSTKPYYTDRIYFDENAGLYILIQFIEPENYDFIKIVLACFRLLGEEGIGTDRSSGNGLFEVMGSGFEDFTLSVPESGQHLISMGLFCPSDNDLNVINWDKSFWTIFKRGGYMGGSSISDFYRIKKNAVNMIGEGSILTATESLAGKLVNLRPKWDTEDMHDVWRDGRTIGLPIVIQ